LLQDEKGINRCIESLETLINEVDSIDDHQNSHLFGTYVTQRRKYTDESYTFSDSGPPSPRRAAAEFGRYMTVLERLTALTADQRPDKHDTEQRMNQVFENCSGLIEDGYRKVIDSRKVTGVVEGLNDVRDTLHQSQKVDFEGCAKVARAILVAWAHRVPEVELKVEIGEGKKDIRALKELPLLSVLGV
jgi:hypothetical protein